MPYSRYDNRRDSRKPEPLNNVNPWENGFPQGSQGGAADQLSLAGNLLGQILGRTAGVGGVGANLATSLVVAQALQSQNRGGLLPLGGGAFNNQSSFNSNRGRDFTSRSSRISPSRSRSFRRSRSRSRDRSRRGGNRGEDRKFPAPHKRTRSPAASAAAPVGERPAHEIYIGNYPVRFRENDIRKLFEEHDIKVLSIRLKHDGLKVFAFAETENKEEIEKAVKAMDSKEIAGRRLRVRSAKDKDKKTTTTTASSSAAAAPKPAPKKVPELNECHVTRHLAFAFVGFLERQMTSEGVREEDVAEMKVAKEAIKKAFKLPEDDSLKITRRLELIFMQNNRREIKPPQDEVEEETKTKGSKDDKDDNKNDSIDQDFEQDDDSGNWKRRKVAKDDDEDEEEAEADGTKTSEAELRMDENDEEEEEVADHRDEVMTVMKSATEAIEASKALVNADDDDDDVLEIEDDQGRKEIEEEDEKKPDETEKGSEGMDVSMEKEGNDRDEENNTGFDESSPTKTGRGGLRGRASGRARRSRGRRP